MGRDPTWRRRLGLILDELSEIQFGHGEFASTSETASHWIALDGLNEVAYRRKMRAHFAAGERGQALQTYDACRSILAAELNIEPEPDTEALVARHPLAAIAPDAEPQIARVADRGGLSRSLRSSAATQNNRSWISVLP